MITIQVQVPGLDALSASLGNQAKQIAFAASKALNATGKKVAEAMPAEIAKVIDKPTPFTSRGVRILSYANKSKLSTTVGFMDAQAKYMQFQIMGGTRAAGAAGLKLPGAVKINEFGNIPRGLIAQLVAVANKERKLGRVKARRIAVSRDVELFYGDPTSPGGKPYPRGIYKRVAVNGQSRLIPIIVFPKVAAHYKARFDFHGKALAVVDREWQGQFKQALSDALRTAR